MANTSQDVSSLAVTAANSTRSVTETGTLLEYISDPATTPVYASTTCASAHRPPPNTVTIWKTAASAQHSSSDPSSTVSQSSAWPTQRNVIAISIAIAAVGFFLGALSMLCLLKRRPRNLAQSRTHENQQRFPEFTQPTNISGTGDQAHKLRLKPPWGDDSAAELISRQRQLGRMIQDHAESNYARSEGKHDKDDLVEAIEAPPFLKHDAQFLAHLCSAPATRHVAIHHLIAGALFSAIDFNTFYRHALLPTPVITFWETLRNPHGDKKLTESKSVICLCTLRFTMGSTERAH